VDPIQSANGELRIYAVVNDQVLREILVQPHHVTRADEPEANVNHGIRATRSHLTELHERSIARRVARNRPA
jgi:hypothetical protein